MSTVAWVASHTGLPSFGFDGLQTGREYTLQAYDATSRSWSIEVTGSSGRYTYLSDPLALPGVETTYSLGGESWTLTRPIPVGEDGERQWWRALISRRDGRTIPDLVWVKNNDPRAWSSGISRFNSRIARWDSLDPALTGDGVITLLEPSRARSVRKLFMSHEPLIIVPGAPSDSLPPRVVTVTSVSSKRITGNGWLEFSVAWSEVPLDSPMLTQWRSGGAPVIEWGEWDARDGAWASRTYEELCVLIAGMPS